MPYLRNLIPATVKPARGKGNYNGARRYDVPAPTIKQDIADRLRAVERAAALPEGRASRCCGRCKTPYNCGNKACPCHTIRHTP